MKAVGIVLFIALFGVVFLLALIVIVEFFRLGAYIRRHHPALHERFSGYGTYPASVRHNLMLFIIGKSQYVSEDEGLLERCQRVRTLGYAGAGLMIGSGFLVMVLGS